MSKYGLSVGGTQDNNGKQINKEHAGYKENQSALVGSYPDEGTIKDTESSPNVCSETNDTDTLTQVVISHKIQSKAKCMFSYWLTSCCDRYFGSSSCRTCLY